ncbi:hypothetical protein UFOVP75_150 [uncultured Caudovirales phage]|uniref:Uncharacterized protein n=1 Tax=uncultured Caudovirales phage TaxID=2100421 RepID=A0A6J5L169_9CAUD|nr:hypothetical protein UFOVP75_150 [uncultured Caudovirales phage]
MAQINTLGQFKQHIDEHRHRVYLLAVHADQNLSSSFRNRLIYRLHDVEKYVVLPFLWKCYGGKGQRSFYDRMNKLGNFIRKSAILALGIEPETDRQLARIEKIADVVDRHCDPVTPEEFGQSAKRPLQDFLSGSEIMLANDLIFLYKIITEPSVGPARY